MPKLIQNVVVPLLIYGVCFLSAISTDNSWIFVSTLLVAIAYFVYTDKKYRQEPLTHTTTRIRLDEKDFKLLVTGGQVNKNGVKIILADIGYYTMAEIVSVAASGLE